MRPDAEGSPDQPRLPTEGLALFVKRDCPTCTLIEPVAFSTGARTDKKR